MQIYNVVWLALPLTVYFVVRKYHLHSGELWMLFYVTVLILSTVLDGWVMQLAYLVIVTALSFHLLSISKQTSGHLSEKKYPYVVRVFLHMQEELSIVVYAICAWLLLRVYTSKSFQYGIGLQLQDGRIFKGLNETLHGWNCTQIEFVAIPLLWLIINTLSYIIAREIIRVESDKDNLYKEYVVGYMVVPFILCSVVVFVINLLSWLNADNMFMCVKYWQSYWGVLVKLVGYCGYVGAVLYFFYVKKGVFEVEGDNDGSDKS